MRQHCTFAVCVEPEFSANLCNRHYKRQLRHGFPGCPTCRKSDLGPHQRECQECIQASFRQLGHEPVDIGAFRNANVPIECRCRKCGTIAPKRLSNLRTFGSQCEGCYGPQRVAFAARHRFTQTQVADILKRAGWTIRGTYLNGNTPVEAECEGCGIVTVVRAGDIHAKLKNGIRQYGCMACVRKRYPPNSKVPEQTANEEFAEAGIDYLSGWIDTQRPVNARCADCRHLFAPSLKHVRAGHGCPRCNLQGFWSVARVRRHPELAVRPTVLYLVEFTDWDVSATDFHKIGVGTTDGINRKRGGQCDRLYRHHLDGARLLDSFQGDLLTCLQAEELIVAHVAPAVYTPTQGRIRGGNTECFLPSVLVELEPWVRRAREALHSTTEVVWA